MQKISWTWRDIVTELGVGAVTDLAIAGGAAALGLGTGPIGWTLLAGAGITAAVWYFTRQMDDNLPDLIDRLEDLDPKPEYELKINNWIDTLKSILPTISAPPTTTDVAQRGQLNAQQYVAMRNLLAYMEQLEKEWRTDVYPNGLTDIVFDAGQVNYTISETLNAIKTSITKMREAAKQDADTLLNQIKEKSKIDYKQLSTDIVGLYDQLTSLYGKAPEWETNERNLEAAFNFAKNIVGRGEEFKAFTQQDLTAMLPLMNKVKELFSRALQAKQPAQKTSSHQALSKRALILGDGSRISDTESPIPHGQLRQAPLTSKSPTVAKLQMALNVINEKIGSPTKCIVDGLYGKQTAGAVVELMGKSKAVADMVAPLDAEQISNVSAMNQNPGNIKDLFDAFYSIALQLKESGGKGTEQPAAQCNPEKFNPTPAEMLACLKEELQVEEPNTGKRMYAYDWMRSLGVSDSTMISWVTSLFPPSDYRPKDWSPSVLVSHVKSEFARAQKNKNPTQLGNISIPKDDNSLIRYMKNYFEVIDPPTNEKMGVYFWLQGKGLDKYISLKMMNDFINKQQGGQRIWNTATTPRQFTSFVESLMGGREGAARII